MGRGIEGAARKPPRQRGETSRDGGCHLGQGEHARPHPLNGMKSLTEHLWFEVPSRRGFVNITLTVEDLVQKSGVQEGLCLINAMHISASVFINDAEDGLLHDYEVWLEKLAPHAPTSQY